MHEEHTTRREERTAPERRRRLGLGRVLVVGVGGLGSAAALLLAEAGVGTIGLVDGDRVEVSNLQRQVLHDGASIGRLKVDSAAAALRRRWPRVQVRLHRHRLDALTQPRLFRDYDFAIDATDGAAAKLLINDGAVATATPYSHAGVLGWQGQTMTVIAGKSACYRCLFPCAPEEADLPTCETAGVVGPVAGVFGALQASEAIRFLLGEGDLLLNRLLTYDGLAGRWRTVPLYRSPHCPVCAAGRRSAASDGAPAPLSASHESEGRQP
jgi:molybdopterin/thiamine biosynthesis adenylyltransferase